MSHEYLIEGDAINYANVSGAIIPTGEMILTAGNTVVLGVTTRPIPVGETSGICRDQGAVFNCDKAVATVFAVGDAVNFVVATKLATSAVVAAGIIPLGRCVESSGNGPGKVKVAVNFT
jgi:hypothetical protein